MSEVSALHSEILLNHVTLPVLASLVTYQIAEKLLKGPQTAEELSASTDINPNRLFRYLRVASASGYFILDTLTNQWANTPKSIILTDPLSKAIWSFMGNPLIGEHFLHMTSALTSTNDPRQDRNKPNIFIELSQNPHLLQIFQTLMTEQTKAFMPAILKGINIREAQNLLDLGGGDGSLAIELAKTYPSIKVTVFDRAEIKGLCEHLIAQNQVQDRVQFIEGNFFEEVPSGYDCIVLKHILHD